MTIANACNIPLDPYTAWQISAGAMWCHRLSAAITHNVCEANSSLAKTKGAFGEHCCKTCSGLDDQRDLIQANPSLVLVRDADKTTESEPETPSGSAATENSIDVSSGSDETTGQTYEGAVPGDGLEGVELEDEELLVFFPELKEDPWLYSPRFSEYQEEAPRRAVYHGRCKKCGSGYMENIRENGDDNVFRCLVCGWRTSPEYECNRAIHAVGGAL